MTINDSDESLIIGCFENNGKKAFVMVNMSEPSDGRKTDVKFTLNASDAVIYKQGTKDKLTDSNGIYSLSLESGEGVFIALL